MKHAIFAALMSFAIVATLVPTSASAMNVRRHVVKVEARGTRVRMDVEVGSASALDILFVIDDSASMGYHQANFLANVGELVRAAKASGADVHAGVITTTVDLSVPPGAPGKGELVGAAKKYASTADEDFDDVLSANLKAAMTTYGSGMEQPFEAARLALSEPLASTLNRGFIRAGAALAIFVLTDEDDQSPLTVDQYIQMLKILKGQSPISFHAAYVPTAAPTCRSPGTDAAVRIEEALTKFGTINESVSLCDAAFGSKLKKIGEGYGIAALRVVQLQHAPILSSMRVMFGNQNLDAGDLEYGWVYDATKMQILLGEKIDWKSEPAGTRLLIDYLTN